MPPGVNWLSTIHHGLPANLYAPGPGRGGYLLFLGRIAPEKRPDRAIEIARRAGMPLKIAAKIDAADQRYFRESIEPLLADPLIEFVGEVNDTQKQELLGNALALLFPIDWPEPFGLVMIEAMAAGTPVIAWPEGSVPEVLEPGVTGALVCTLEEASRAARTIESLDRRLIRRAFERSFTACAMAERYVAAYESLLAKRPARRASSVMAQGDLAPAIENAA
jgi:glycosyltransferase involved in cell wall biosynthesis